MAEPKACTTCQQIFPATPEFFNKNRTRRDGLQETCRACKKMADAIYRTTHSSELRAYRAAHAEEHRVACKAWRAANPEHVQAKNAEHRATHREERREYCAVWRAENPELMRVLKAAWNAANPEKVTAMSTAASQRRRARFAGALVNDFTQAQWEEMQAMYAYRCVYCPLDCLACKKKRHRLTQDHITPLAKGGDHTASNILPACPSCNSKKGTKTPTVSVQPVLLMQAPPKKGRSLFAGMEDVEEGADGWILITLPKGVLAKFSRFEFALALKRGKAEQRALRQAAREAQAQAEREGERLAWIE